MKLATLLAFVLLAGCVHDARKFSAPDPTAMLDHSRKLAAAVADARSHVLSAGKALAGSEKSQEAAKALFDIVLPKIDALPLDTPAEMKLAVASIQEDMSSLRELVNDSLGDTTTARTELTAAGAKLEEATSEKNLTQQAADKYIAEAEKLAKQATDSDAARAKAEKQNDHRGNILGILGALCLAAIASHFMGLIPVYGYALPVVGAIIGYFGSRIFL